MTKREPFQSGYTAPFGLPTHSLTPFSWRLSADLAKSMKDFASGTFPHRFNAAGPFNITKDRISIFAPAIVA
ncbi:MAG: hypothetical protein EOS81_00090 [Mesorhizobium sp.]|uniref:hypothetical protein n=1 Tax=unclassified Mesorhizobium TaxID=325217 RepID=UPI000F75A695|nr:hypothetical protein [Mesorhizobium sp. M2A.F.Ca.ET.046.03.2.1]AZO34771.1 hypothetical protein EJ072_10160 [Mesorhizobium sp. M2A.F.Ca.ET.046.03.2.1]RWE21673.1 MAG: hypothetical protein EOS76_03905 [Mesorhizobium sp.]RWF06276.1 MAG: hypothetical protein EOS81_00090 [Mesorhizobium sp.]